MSEGPSRTPRRRGESTTPADPPDATAERPIPAWRRRLYRVPVLGAVVYLLWPPRTKRPTTIRRVVSWTTAIVAVLGIGMVGYPWAGDKYPFFYRVPVEKLIEWSNVLSDLQTNRIQDRLEDEFLAMTDPSAARDGEPLTRIEIPKIGVDSIVVEGTSPSALKAGAGHYPQTPLPGEAGNVAIAGHRTTYGRPFNRIDGLRPGDPIILTTPVGRYTYEVVRDPWITDPYDWSVIEQAPEPLLTLTTCHPKGGARERLVVRAKLMRTEPVSARAPAA